MSRTETYKIKGMHCASCASIIEKTLKKTDGVESVEANYGTEAAKITFNESVTDPQHLSSKIERLGYSFILPTAEEMGMSPNEHAAHLGLNQSKKEKLAELADMRNKIFSIIPLTLLSIYVMGWEILAQFNVIPTVPAVWEGVFNLLFPLMATYALFVVGKPYLMGFYRFLRYGKANMDTLIGIGTTAAYLYSIAITACRNIKAVHQCRSDLL